MPNQDRIAYEFGTFRLDVDERRLWQRDVIVPLTPKLFDTLRLLVEERGRLVLKESFMRAIWSEASVTDASLAHNISALRKLLGHTDDHPVIETVAKKGYRFLMPVRQVAVVENVLHSRVGPPEAPAASVGLAPVAAFVSTVNHPDSSLSAPDSGAALVGAGARPVSNRRNVYRHTAAAFSVFVMLLGIGGYVLVRRLEAPSDQTIRSLLILPLDNMSSDAGQDYLADGLTDGLTTELAKIGLVRVISRTTAVQTKRERKPLAQVRREFNVDAVVEGSLTRVGNRVRVSARLIRSRPRPTFGRRRTKGTLTTPWVCRPTS